MKKVIDTEALLAFYLDEPGASKMEQILRGSLDGTLECFLNIVNMTEFYYILARKSKEIAEDKEKSLRRYGIEIIPLDDDSLWKEAAWIKTNYALSLADAFAAATAKLLKADLVTGSDKEFEDIEVRVENIRPT